MEAPEKADWLAGNYIDASTMTIEDVFRMFGASPDGLSGEEAAARLAQAGGNVIAGKRVGPFEILRRQMASPMVGLLVFAGVVAAALGERLDAGVIFGILSVNAVIGFVQEYRSERALEKLAAHLDPRARVRRGGEILTVARKDLVPGDVVILRTGDIAPADLRVSAARNLLVDESVLTGESVHVAKTDAVLSARPSQPYQAGNAVFMMTRVVSGSGEGIVVATGRRTVIGKVAKSVEETVRISGFQRDTAKLSGFLLKTVAVVLGTVFAANLALKGTEQLVPQLLFAVAMAVSVIPEALPAVTAITFSTGALRLARKHVVVKRLAAIEDLGRIQVLCTDKTGTLTEGIMALRDIFAADRVEAHALALAACAEEEFGDVEAPKTFGGALMAAADEKVRKRHAAMRRLRFDAFDPARRRTSALVETDGRRTLAVFGAVEEILPRCRMTEAQRTAALRSAGDEGWKGRRVLAVAARTVDEGAVEAAEDGLTCLGIITFVDPIKPTAEAAVRDAGKLDVQVKILTGDAPEVAGAVGKEIGVTAGAGDVVTGADLDAMDAAGFRAAVATRSVFARVSPEQKYRIIEELKRTCRVGFLGEGINDAPALKLADAAMVVESASDVAREAADILLLRKDLHVIIDGIREGRAIFANVVKYVKYTLVGNFGNFLAISGLSLVVDFLPLLPVQILLNNLLTDLPLIAVAEDRVDAGELAKPKTFDIRGLAAASVFLGLVSSTFDFLFFALFRGRPPGVIQTDWFVFSVLTELALIYSIRTRGPFWRGARPGGWLVALTTLSVALALLLPLTGTGQAVFRFIRVDSPSLTNILALVVLYFAATEAVKRAFSRFTEANGAPKPAHA